LGDADLGISLSVGEVERHDDVIEVTVTASDVEAPGDVLSAVDGAFSRQGPVRQVIVRLIGAPRGMGALARALATDARRRQVTVHWRL
jgi:hypothetical protein